MPCPLFYGAVSCGAERSFKHTAVVVPGMVQVPGLCTRCVLVFLLSSVDCPLSVPMPPPRPANSTRTAVQNVTPTSTQHSAGQLAMYKHLTSWHHYQLAIRAKQSRASSSCPLYICFKCILPCASVAGGVSRPRSGVVCLL